MDNCYGQHGWKEFHRNRKDILSEFDKILEQTSNRPIQVAHGQGVEAYIRKWLSEFLPRKYAVTSGYIIPDLYDQSSTVYHYDIIIYDSLESPVLWTEGNQDNSEQGKYRAIPAKHVVAVYEVKSRLTKKNVSDSIKKLDEVSHFHEQLHKNYSCGMIFIELKSADKNKGSIIKELYNAKDIKGFSGGLVLRFEDDDSATGVISICNIKLTEDVDNNRCTPLAKVIDDLNIYVSEEGNVVIGEQGAGLSLMGTNENKLSYSKMYSSTYRDGEVKVGINWSRSGFSSFCIELLSSLEGLPFNDEKKPSFGRIFDNIERVKTPLQSIERQGSRPFLEIALHPGGDNGELLIIDEDDRTLKYWVEIKNFSETSVKMSDDFYKTSFELESKKIAVKENKLKFEVKNQVTIEQLLKSEVFEIPYRLVYFPSNTDKEYIAIERTLTISNNKIEMA